MELVAFKWTTSSPGLIRVDKKLTINIHRAYWTTFSGNRRNWKRRRGKGRRRKDYGSESRSCERGRSAGIWRKWGVSKRRSRRSCRWRLPWKRGDCCWLSATWNRYGSSLSCWPGLRYQFTQCNTIRIWISTLQSVTMVQQNVAFYCWTPIA